MGGLLGNISTFGPWANSCFWAYVSGVLDMIRTHLDVIAGAVVVVAICPEFKLKLNVNKSTLEVVIPSATWL